MTPAQALLLLAICFAWGSHLVVVRATVDLIPPLTYVAIRMGSIALILSPLLRWHRGVMGRVLIAGACFGGLNYAFMFYGLRFTTASIGAVLLESYVIIATIFSVLFLGEKVGWRRSLGIAGAFAGVVVIATAEGDATGSRNLALGTVLLLAAATSEATGAIFVKKIEGIKPLSLLAWFGVVGTVVSVTLSLLIEEDQFAWVGTEAMLPIGLAAAYSVFVASLFGHASYYWLLQRAPLSVIAPSGLLITFVAVFLGVVLLGESLTIRLVLGGLMVVSGVGVVLLRSHSPDREQVIAAAAAGADEREAREPAE